MKKKQLKEDIEALKKEILDLKTKLVDCLFEDESIDNNTSISSGNIRGLNYKVFGYDPADKSFRQTIDLVDYYKEHSTFPKIGSYFLFNGTKLKFDSWWLRIYRNREANGDLDIWSKSNNIKIILNEI